jgi:hypothetical protein
MFTENKFASMNKTPFTPEEREQVRKFFGKTPEELSSEEFRETHRRLRAKFHPDNFEKFADETVREMATERFQQIERLAAKIESLLRDEAPPPGEAASGEGGFTSGARFAFDDMKIEINTTDKDLKYHLFGTRYRWLVYGDRFKIPDTGGSIIIDENHQGHRIGYRESIRLYLTFGPSDDLDAIIRWLYERIRDRASSLLVEGKIVPIDPGAMQNAMKKLSLLPTGST